MLECSDAPSTTAVICWPRRQCRTDNTGWHHLFTTVHVTWKCERRRVIYISSINQPICQNVHLYSASSTSSEAPLQSRRLKMLFLNTRLNCSLLHVSVARLRWKTVPHIWCWLKKNVQTRMQGTHTLYSYILQAAVGHKLQRCKLQQICH